MAPIRNIDRFLREFPKAVSDDNAAVFVGAGVSVGAGYPSWRDLLHDIGDELGVSSHDVQDLAALAQWSIGNTGGSNQIRQVIRDQIGPDHDIPPALSTLVRMPIRHIWTTNYDRLIERAFATIRRPYQVISASSDLSLRTPPGAARIYKMHGSVERLDDVVISTDDYEMFRSRRGAFLPLLQSHMTSLSMLFVGLSFTDPNLRHVLSTIRESFTEGPPPHYAIVRPPQKRDFRSDAEFDARLAQHSLWAKDLQRYGLFAVEIDNYDDVPLLLDQLERRVARRRVWVSGSWPLETATAPDIGFVHKLSEVFGYGLAKAGLSLVSGSGLLVGSASMSGFLSGLQATAGWDLERRLVVRPFPQPLGDAPPDRSQWHLLRTELARLSGAVVFIGGAKMVDGHLLDAEGVHAERKVAQERGAFLLPIGASGGSARAISKELIGSKLSPTGLDAMRPTDEQLVELMDESLGPEKLAAIALDILKVHSKH